LNPKDLHGNEGGAEDKRLPGNAAVEFGPVTLAIIGGWADQVGEGAPRPFRTQVTALLERLRIGSNRLYSSLRKFHPEVYARLNRLRASWYAHRDTVAKHATRQDEPTGITSVKLGLHRSTLAREALKRKERTRKHRGSRFTLSDAAADALDDFEAELEVFEHEKELPFRPFPAVERFAGLLGLTNRDARECIGYLRPDLWARYGKQVKRYSRALDAECRGTDDPALIGDRFELETSTVRKHRLRLKARDEGKPYQ